MMTQLVKGGFVFGGARFRAVLIARDELLLLMFTIVGYRRITTNNHKTTLTKGGKNEELK
jgi:hypothetical protein